MWPLLLLGGGLLLLVVRSKRPACIEPHVPMSVEDLARRLEKLGYHKASGDAVCDEALRQAVGRFQRDHGLAVRESVDRSTEVYLRSLTPDLPDLGGWVEEDWRS